MQIEEYSNHAMTVYDDKNYKEAFSIFLDLANQGDYKSQYMLGTMLFYGQGCEKNKKDAYSWYKRSADNGEAVSQYLIGHCYLYGLYSFKINENTALKYFTLSASQDYPNAIHDLAIMYMNGIAIKSDTNKAKILLEKNVKNDYKDSIYLLAQYYAKGYFGFFNRFNLKRIIKLLFSYSAKL